LTLVGFAAQGRKKLMKKWDKSLRIKAGNWMKERHLSILGTPRNWPFHPTSSYTLDQSILCTLSILQLWWWYLSPSSMVFTYQSCSHYASSAFGIQFWWNNFCWPTSTVNHQPSMIPWI
jgi:hypothetical protein